MEISVLDRSVSEDKGTLKTEMTVKMLEGLWRLKAFDRIVDAQTVSRKATLTCLEDTWLLDFVMRFRFKKEFFPQAEIAGRQYTHQNTNLYYQHPVDSCSLKGEGMSLRVSIEDFQAPQSMAPYLYVRDNAGEWVVHARMLPTVSHKNVIKLCNPWAARRPIPKWVSDLCLAIPEVKRALWYRCERQPYQGRIMRRINPQAFPLIKVSKGTTLVWKVNMHIRNEELFSIPKDNKLSRLECYERF